VYVSNVKVACIYVSGDLIGVDNTITYSSK